MRRHDCDPEAIARGLERALEELLARARPRCARLPDATASAAAR
ncbi:MAG: hypothetical protein M5U28_46515 [Sandaracinaceae bacterium]|nr:hypothetical protein [Sandaracinaceae bacterium]